MPTYRLYDVIVGCDLALPELPATDGAATMTITGGTVAVPRQEWFDIWPHSDGSSWVRACRTATGYQIRHGSLAAFDVHGMARSIVYDAPECDEALLRHFLVDQVVPLMLSLEVLILHASSVAMRDGTVAFVGPGGAGKSTLALALSRRGWPMVSDDGLMLQAGADGVVATPAYEGVRLWTDSATALAAAPAPNTDGAATTKRCYPITPSARAVPQLSRIYVLDPQPSPAVAVERLAGAEAAIAVVRQTYRLALDDRAALTRQLDDIVALTRHVPIWRLTFPRSLDRLALLAASVERELSRVREVNA